MAAAAASPALQPRQLPPLRALRSAPRSQGRQAIAARSPAASGACGWACSRATAERRQPWRRCHAPCRRQQQQQHQRLAALQVEAPSEGMAVEAAWQLLTDFTAKEARGLAQPMLNSQATRQRLRDALLVAAAAPHPPAGWAPDGAAAPEVLLGVVASDVRLAVRALRDYCQALGLPFLMPESRVPGAAAAPAIAGAVYVKYNSATGLCYASQYEGRDRGVLVQLGQQQLGHLPLGLFDEAMARPPPAL